MKKILVAAALVVMLWSPTASAMMAAMLLNGGVWSTEHPQRSGFTISTKLTKSAQNRYADRVDEVIRKFDNRIADLPSSERLRLVTAVKARVDVALWKKKMSEGTRYTLSYLNHLMKTRISVITDIAESEEDVEQTERTMVRSERCNVSKGAWSRTVYSDGSRGSCTAVACASGYRISGGACVPEENRTTQVSSCAEVIEQAEAVEQTLDVATSVYEVATRRFNWDVAKIWSSWITVSESHRVSEIARLREKHKIDELWTKQQVAARAFSDVVSAGRSCWIGTRECGVTWGKGSQRWGWSSWGSCVATSCSSGYDLVSGMCRPQPERTSPEDSVPATAALAAYPLSPSLEVVFGTRDVEALAFTVTAGESSPIKVRGIRITKDSWSLAFANTAVSAVKLYKNSVSDANLVKQIGGSSISDDVANFDSIAVDIVKNQTQKFVVTVSIADDRNLAWQNFKLRVAEANGLNVANPYGNAATVSGNAVSERTVSVASVGALTVEMDNADPKTAREKSVLAGSTSPEVAAVRLTAANEAITAKNIRVTFSGPSVVNALAAVSLHRANGSLIASRAVISSTVLFENVNYAVAESETIYVKVVPNKIGKGQIGTATALQALVAVTDAEGTSSKKAAAVSNGLIYSNAFAISSVRVSAVAFVDSFGGVHRTTKLFSGNNNLAILAITADNTANTKQASAEILKTVIDELKIKVAQSVSTGATVLSVEKIGGNGSTASLAVSGGYAVGSLAGLGADAEISGGQTTYFLIKGSIGLDAGVAGNESVQVSLENLNDGAVVYSDNDSGASVTALRLSVSKLDGALVTD